MTKTHFENVGQVVSWRLCIGCGACVPACSNKAVSLVDIPDRGIRPVVDVQKCEKCNECLKVCPGVGMEHQPFSGNTIAELRQAWGPVLELWEGYASDPEIRFKGSSGGIATSLALYCLEKEDITGVLHITVDEDNPLKNKTVFSRNRDDLLKACGSRYAPAAPCEKFKWIETADGKCIFVGKPCDIVALRKAQAVNPVLNDKTAIAISIFCAGTPTSDGTHKVLENLGVKANRVSKFRYRGYGWPGMTTIIDKDGQTHEMMYEESWGKILSKHGQLRCRFCPDSTGEFADIACGDPWYCQVEPNKSGRSLVLVRTERGRKILQNALRAGYVGLQCVESTVLPISQKALLRRRSHLWGRLQAIRIMQIPAPHFEGFSLFSNWLGLSVSEKIRSIAGTFKRIFHRKLYRPFEGSGK